MMGRRSAGKSGVVSYEASCGDTLAFSLVNSARLYTLQGGDNNGAGVPTPQRRASQAARVVSYEAICGDTLAFKLVNSARS